MLANKWYGRGSCRVKSKIFMKCQSIVLRLSLPMSCSFLAFKWSENLFDFNEILHYQPLGKSFFSSEKRLYFQWESQITVREEPVLFPVKNQSIVRKEAALFPARVPGYCQRTNCLISSERARLLSENKLLYF